MGELRAELIWEVTMRPIFVALCSIVVAGCTTPIATYAPITSAPENLAFDNGVPVTLSTRPASRVLISPPMGADADLRPEFHINIVNYSQAAVTIGPENITAQTADGRPLHVIPAEQLQREAQDRADGKKFAAALQIIGNSLSAAGAGYSSGTGNYSGDYSSFGSGGSRTGHFRGTYVGSQYDSSAAAKARADANLENALIAQNTNAQVGAILAGAQSGTLLRQTIAPGGQFSTPVTIEALPDNAVGMVLTVTVGEEIHEFQWNYSRTTK